MQNNQSHSLINSRNFWFWFGGIWLGVGLLFLLLGAFFAWNALALESRLASEGQVVQWVMPVVFCGVGTMLALLGGFTLLKAIATARLRRRRDAGANGLAR